MYYVRFGAICPKREPVDMLMSLQSFPEAPEKPVANKGCQGITLVLCDTGEKNLRLIMYDALNNRCGSRRNTPCCRDIQTLSLHIYECVCAATIVCKFRLGPGCSCQSSDL